MAAGQARPRERAFAGAWLLSGAMVASGALAYAFQVLAARRLGADAFGKIAVLWAAMFLVAIVIYRPLEQTASRALAERLARGEEVGSVTRSLLLIWGVLLAVVGIGAAAAWKPLADRLFLGDDLMTAMLVAGILGYGVSYVSRGLCAGVRWFQGCGVNLLVDGGVRLLLAAPLVVVASEATAGAAVAAAGLAGALVPLWLGRRHLRVLSGGGTGAPFRLRGAVAFAGPASVVAASEQVLVNGGPLLVVLAGGGRATGAAGVVFAATMLVRVPVYVFQGLASSLLPNLTRLHTVAGEGEFRRALRRALTVLGAAGALITAAAALLGPLGMRVVFGAGFEAGRGELTLLGFGVGCYLAAATCSQALLALDRGGRAAGAWAASAAVFVAAYALVGGQPLFRVSAAFALASTVNVALLGLALVRARVAR